MSEKWNLDSIYTSLQLRQFNDDKNKLSEHLFELKEWSKENLFSDEDVINKICKFIKLLSKYKNVYSKLSSYTYLIYIGDNSNFDSLDILDDIENNDISANNILVKFSKWLNTIENIEQIINSSSEIQDHVHYLETLIHNSKYLLDEDLETLIAKNQMTGSKSWERLYMEMTSTLEINVNIDNKIETFTLQELQKMLLNNDAKKRYLAYINEGEALGKISKVAAACLNGISGEAINTYELRAYKSTLDKVLVKSKMEYQTIESMFCAIKGKLPQLRKYYSRKAKILGYEDSLPFHEIFAPITYSEKTITYTHAKQIIIDSFKSFSDELSNYAIMVFENEWVDSEVRKGKANYGLCVDISSIKESRIMTSFSGTLQDTIILAHEIGHAYHSYCLRNENILNSDYPTAIAETASIFTETLVCKAIMDQEEFKGNISILEKSISDSCYYIVEFYARYLFENKLYELRKSGPLSIDQINDLMKECIIEAFGDSIDIDSIHPYMWMNKIGYFMAGNEYLNFPYSFGLLFSKGLYSQYINNKSEFLKIFEEKLSKTSRNNIDDIAKIFESDLNSSEFWNDSLQIIIDDINTFCAHNA